MLKFYIWIFKDMCLQNGSINVIDTWPDVRYWVLFRAVHCARLSDFEDKVMDLEHCKLKTFFKIFISPEYLNLVDTCFCYT